MRIQSFIIIISAFFTLNLSAQISMEEYKKKRKAELEQYKNRVKTEFEKYREKRNSEFARLISQRWKAIQDYKGLKPPVKPEPVKPIIKDRNEPKIPPVKIPIDKISKIPKPEKRVPLNIPPGTIPYDEYKNVFSSTFYGAQVTIYSDREDISIKLRSIDEQEIGRAWNELSDGRMEEVVNNFLIHREEMKLNDYTFAIMVGKLCYGYSLVEKKRKGEFYPGKAIEYGVPKGPMWGILQHGGSVVLENGLTVTPDMVMGRERAGRKISYVTDTLYFPEIADYVHDSDVLFCEGMFEDALEESAREKKHMTARQAAMIARDGGCSRLMLQHYSPRYSKDELKVLEREAKEIFPATILTKDRMSFEIPLKE